MKSFERGFFYGTGADINISLGWVPDRVELHNYTDGTTFDVGFPSAQVVPFTSGGTTEIKAGDTIYGLTSKASAKVLFVLADTGTWAGGDAAGNFIIDAETLDGGPFQSEGISNVSGGTDYATVTVEVDMGYDSDTEIAAATDITAYLGTTTLGKGFTFKAASNTDAKMFIYSAWRDAKD